MAATSGSDSSDPKRALIELGESLEYALKNPGIDSTGTLHFSARRSGGGDPISRYGGGCPRPTRGAWTLLDLVELAALVQKYARDLGGARAGGPAPRRPA